MTTATAVSADIELAERRQAVIPVVNLEGTSRELSPEIVMVADPQGVRAEAIRALRTHIIAQHIHGGRRALAICAASAEVGCSFVAANLAVSLAQVGVKTLLIDGNLRAPGLDRLIPPARPDLGLRQYLASTEVAFNDVIDQSAVPDLSLLPSGGVSQNPQELLAKERFRELMEICLRDYDMTIVDTPPANASADGRRISTVVGYSLVVAQQGRSLVGDVKTLVSELEGDRVRVVGTVLNEA
jgi:capsular exopolysaccharide synthesis family protein